MMPFKMNPTTIKPAIWFLVNLAILAEVQVVLCDEGQQPITRALSEDVDEGSCVCGLSKAVLDRLETIVQQANAQSCSIVSVSTSQPETTAPQISEQQLIQTQETTTSRDREPDLAGSSVGGPSAQSGSSQVSSQQQQNKSNGWIGSWTFGGTQAGKPTSANDGDQSAAGKLTDQIQALQAQLASLRPPTITTAATTTATQHPESSIVQIPATTTTISTTTSTAPSEQQPVIVTQAGGAQQPQNPSIFGGSFSNWGIPSGLAVNQVQSSKQPTAGGSDGTASLPSISSLSGQLGGFSGGFGFLQGLNPNLGAGTASQVTTAATLSGQDQKVEPQEVQQALVSTVPNVVSNIFTNIQDFAIQTEQDPNKKPAGDVANQLTSIDGSSAQLGKNDTADQITAQGEQLFVQWIEHQIQTYKMTASMAAYIRRSALNLFRRIVRQYVQRIERLGGAVEGNVRQATQLALNNTQNLISFLLRNYLNVAGGFMQIIGEQVSRVGKRLDSTGGNIAHINLNPFDIVSNVIDSLPNPSRYSEYFRAFGKYLIGESAGLQQQANQAQQQPTTGGEQQQTQQDPDRHRGLFSKTMGALGKTLGSWIG